MDLRRFLETIRQHQVVVSAAIALGLVAGVAFAMLRPPLLSSKAVVVLPPASHDIATQVLVAGSDPVLNGALPNIQPPSALATLRNRVHVTNPTTDVLLISGEGKTAAQAEQTANAVAESYVAYVSSPTAPGGRMLARILEEATTATGTLLPVRLITDGLLAALAGALGGAIIALALSRSDRKLRKRDELAAAIGVPVLAALPVAHPSDVDEWARLLTSFEPAAVYAWSLRQALHRLGVTDLRGGRVSVAILTLATDKGALALGPQLAVFAASRGIPTGLVIGPQQDPDAAATLRAACTATSGRTSPLLQVAAGDRLMAGWEPPALTIHIAVIDGHAPRVAATPRTAVTVLGVSAGAATAEQLARVAVSAADSGRNIAGILVADPDRSDHTTGRLPRAGRPARTLPTRLATAGRVSRA